MSQKTPRYSQCTWPAPVMVWIILGLNSSSNCQNTGKCNAHSSNISVAICCVQHAIHSVITIWKIFLSAVFLPEGSGRTQCEDRGCCWDKQAAKRSRGNPISHQWRQNFWEGGLLKIQVGSLNPQIWKDSILLQIVLRLRTTGQCQTCANMRNTDKAWLTALYFNAWLMI